MNSVNPESILKEVTHFFLSSRDFNGIRVEILFDKFRTEWQQFYEALCQLVEDDFAGIIYADVHINPHIIRTGFEDKKNQINKLVKSNLKQACIYPRPKYLGTVVNRKQYEGKPYRLYLALGEPQLAFRSFDFSVLEFYRNDPRYNYENDDVSGKICYKSKELKDSDRIYLQTFGFSYDKNLNRAVAVFLCYLATLSSEHQLVWQAKELHGDFKLHPDYYRGAIIGDWPERIPICRAFLKELYIINQMAKAMGRPPLFRNDFGEYGENRPNKFAFLIRTTLEEFNNFVLLLDKMISDNINKDFFQNEVSYTREVRRGDGRIEIQNKSTLKILDEWIREKFNIEDDFALWGKSMKAFKKVRKIRQIPAHAVDENIFDQRYFKDQRELIIEAYSAIRILRLLLANDPAVESANTNIPSWLQEGRIWTQ